MLKRTESQVNMDSYVISLCAANFYQLPGSQGFQISTNMDTKRKYEEASVLAGKGYKSVTDCFDTPDIGVKRMFISPSTMFRIENLRKAAPCGSCSIRSGGKYD
jgi:hypothetical protein